ncbi:MAG: hypothetical protein M1828_000568 [Chrysothrix sp. TS-e1954]|nr:MAG: hypothetical protein M1828_000568 [Chrysothrix sp. TS-e1954]
MSQTNLTPVLVGVADVKNNSLDLEDAVEPLQLMLQAINEAAEDTQLSKSARTSLLASLDSVSVVATWTWPYTDLPSLLSEKLSATPSQKHYTEHGGNQPAKILDEAARSISRGQTQVAVLTGGEALASLGAHMAKNKRPPTSWTKPAQGVESVFSPTTRALPEGLSRTHGIGAPIQVYPLYENAFRAHRNQKPVENTRESAKLYADFAKVAESNPTAWSYGKKTDTAEEIGTISRKNRMICHPYPLLMNAFNTVNVAAAVILTSEGHAKTLGIPRERWIYPLAGAGTRDCPNFWERPNFHTSPSISRSLDACLAASRLRMSDIDMYDLYSCFPIVPKLACHHLGLPTTGSKTRTTLLGGLTSFGGAGNNYSMHAITQMTRELRAGRGRHGLILANGGVASYQHAVCLSSRSRRDGSAYPHEAPLRDIVLDSPVPVEDKAEGEAVIETYTVDFGRNGDPKLGHIVGRSKASAKRFLANHGDDKTLRRLASMTEESVGLGGYVYAGDRGQNIFKLFDDARL